MDIYARNFNRSSVVSGSDLVYYGRVEHIRTYKGYSHEVRRNARLKNGKIKGELYTNKSGQVIASGMRKDGLNCHIHIVVSRMSKDKKTSLSPLVNERKQVSTSLNGNTGVKGFDRKQFYSEVEKQFDRQFNYKREYFETFKYRLEQNKHKEKAYNASNGLPKTYYLAKQLAHHGPAQEIIKFKNEILSASPYHFFRKQMKSVPYKISEMIKSDFFE